MIGGEFRTYGVQVATIMEQDPEDRADPMARIFPRITKCSFNKYGPTGSLQRVDAMCVLPINIVNEVFALNLQLHNTVFHPLISEDLCISLVLADGPYNHLRYINVLLLLLQVSLTSRALPPPLVFPPAGSISTDHATSQQSCSPESRDCRY